MPLFLRLLSYCGCALGALGMSEARSSKLAAGMSTWHNPIGKMYKSRFKVQSMSETPYHSVLLRYKIRTDDKIRGACDQVSARLGR